MTGDGKNGEPAGPAAGGPDRRPRVLFVTHETTRTGAPMMLLHFLRWLRSRGTVEFEVLAAKGGALEAEFAAVAPTRRAGDGRRIEARNFDLIYANSVGSSDCVAGLGPVLPPVITHVHELDLGFEWVGPRRMAETIRHTERFVACARGVARRLTERFGIPAERIAVQHEMFDPTGAEARVRTSRAQAGLPEDAVVLAGCGTLDFRKGADLFVQTVQAARTRAAGRREVHGLWIGGATAPEFERGLRRDIRALGLEHAVRLVGETDVPHAWLELADVFCLTSREDPFPLAMLEAAALRKPVIGFAGSGGVEELAELGGATLVPYLAPDAMAAAALAAAGDSGRAATAAELVRRCFSVAARAPALERVLLDFRSGGAAARERERRKPKTLTEVFVGWAADDPLRDGYVRSHLARAAAIAAAREAAGSGRRREAVQLLVRAASADLATRDPWVICEGLLEIGGELVALEPRQAAALRDQAEAVAGKARIDLAPLRHGEAA